MFSSSLGCSSQYLRTSSPFLDQMDLHSSLHNIDTGINRGSGHSKDPGTILRWRCGVKVLHDLGVDVVLLGVVGLIKADQVEVCDEDVCTVQTVFKDISCHHENHVFVEDLFPTLKLPRLVVTQVAEESSNLGIDVVVENRILLVDKCDGIHEEDAHTAGFVELTGLQFLTYNVPDEQTRDQCLARAWKPRQ